MLRVLGHVKMNGFSWSYIKTMIFYRKKERSVYTIKHSYNEVPETGDFASL